MPTIDFGEINDVVHGPVRLATLAFLSTAGSVELQELRRRLRVTDGNLALHVRKLENAGYIVTEKRGAGRASVTRVTLSDAGRDAFVRYLETMARLVEESRAMMDRNA